MELWGMEQQLACCILKGSCGEHPCLFCVSLMHDLCAILYCCAYELCWLVIPHRPHHITHGSHLTFIPPHRSSRVLASRSCRSQSRYGQGASVA